VRAAAAFRFAGAPLTCCVARPGIVCTDSRETGNTKADRPKCFRVHDYLVAVAGDVGTWQAALHAVTWPKVPTERSLVRWMHKLHDATKLDFNELQLLVVTRSYVFAVDGRSVTRADRGAIGSGAAYALGYLRGVPDDLEGAVAAACFYCPWCAGPVRRCEL
jgi:hypothetical protein